MYGFRPYVPVAKRRSMALREMKKLAKKGHPVSPVVIEGRTIASSRCRSTPVPGSSGSG